MIIWIFVAAYNRIRYGKVETVRSHQRRVWIRDKR